MKWWSLLQRNFLKGYTKILTQRDHQGMYEWMNVWMNEWMYEWMNAGYSTLSYVEIKIRYNQL